MSSSIETIPSKPHPSPPESTPFNQHAKTQVSVHDIPDSIYKDYVQLLKRNPTVTSKICYLYSDFRIEHLGFQKVTIPESKFVCFRQKSSSVDRRALSRNELDLENVEITVSNDMDELQEFIASLERNPQSSFPYHQKTIQPPFPQHTPAMIRKQQQLLSNSKKNTSKDINDQEESWREIALHRFHRIWGPASSFYSRYYTSWTSGKSFEVLADVGRAFLSRKPFEFASDCFEKLKSFSRPRDP